MIQDPYEQNLAGDWQYRAEHASDTTHSEVLFPNEDPREVFADRLQGEDASKLIPVKLSESERIGGFTAYQMSKTLNGQGFIDFIRVPVGQAVVEFVTVSMTPDPVERECLIYFPKTEPSAIVNPEHVPGHLDVRLLDSQTTPRYEFKGAAGKLSHSRSKEDLASFEADIVSIIAQANEYQLATADYPTSVMRQVAHEIERVDKEDNRQFWATFDAKDETPLAK